MLATGLGVMPRNLAQNTDLECKDAFMVNEQCLYSEVAEVLIDLESALRQQSLWQSCEPAAEALASTQPFCFDTLSFPEWLQHVFLPQMHAMIDSRQRLPDACGIAPMAEEYFCGSALTQGGVLSALRRLDQLLSGDQ